MYPRKSFFFFWKTVDFSDIFSYTFTIGFGMTDVLVMDWIAG
jgi:hypothetical protein